MISKLWVKDDDISHFDKWLASIQIFPSSAWLHFAPCFLYDIII